MAVLKRRRNNKSASRLYIYIAFLIAVVFIIKSVVESPDSRIDVEQLIINSKESAPAKVPFDITKATHVLGRFKSKEEYTIHTKVGFNELVQSDNTIVSAYFRIRSKHSSTNYDKWMKNFLSIQDSMVIFLSSDKVLIEQVWDLRSHAKNRTVIVELDLEKLPIAELGSEGFWEHQLDIDKEKKIHRSKEVFWIWLSKSWFINQAIRLNFFESDLYMWSDIGSFRDGRMNDKTVIQYPSQLPGGRIMFMAHRDPIPPLNPIWNDKFHDKQNYYTSGSQLVGRKETWAIYHDKFCRAMDHFLDYGLFIGEDQCVLQATCNLNDICAYVPARQVRDNNYFGLRTVVHGDRKYNLFYPNVTKIPSNMEKSTCGYNKC